MTEKKGMAINQKTAVILAVVVVVALVGAVWYFNRPVAGKTQLIVSTTTSLYETGFLSDPQEELRDDSTRSTT